MRMAPTGSECQLSFTPEPGYYLGATYINYGLTAGTMMVSYMSLRFGAGIESRTLIGPMVAFCVAFPLFFFRYARALWLAIDLGAPYDKPLIEGARAGGPMKVTETDRQFWSFLPLKNPSPPDHIAPSVSGWPSASISRTPMPPNT